MKLKDIKLMVAVPAYSSVHTDFAISLLDLSTVFGSKKVHLEIEFVTGSSLVMDARNQLVERFMRSICTHLLFVDSDITFRPEDVKVLIEHANDERKIVCGLYPKKKPNWEMIQHLAKLGAPSHVLQTQLGTLDNSMFEPLDPPPSTLQPVRVKSTGSGFILISKDVFTKIRAKFPEYTYYEKNNYEDGHTERYAYYDTRMIEVDGKRQHLGEDVSFCFLAKDAGFDTWCCPWVNLGHIGSTEYKSRVNYKA